MKFEEIEIINFRNFESIKIALSNKNVFFGMNDVGKTNFLYAIRFVFDREIRKNSFIDSDYYKKNISIPICITIKLDISDIDDLDSQKLRAKLRGNIISGVNTVYIRLSAEYDSNELLGNPILYWGYDLEKLKEIPVHGTFSEIDYVFKIIYVDAYVDVYSLFKKNTTKLIKNSKEDDQSVLKDIENDMDSLNKHISSLSGIQSFEEKITPEFQKFHDDDISIKVKSEIAIKGLYSNIIPYIKNEEDGMLFPTSGEGRRKILAYSIYDLLSDDSKLKYINLFLIEEPENHLHRSLQRTLSNVLFIEDKYKYLFMTTHSSNILTEMNDVNLIRIYNENKINSKSFFFSIPDEFNNSRKTFNNGLIEAIFADKVLLVEGPSEAILFEKILSDSNYFYEADGSYILPVCGIRFKDYFNILVGLGIKCIIKTDNDLRTTKYGYSVIGFSRVNNLIGEKKLPEDMIFGNTVNDKRNLYDDNKIILDEIRKNNHVYLSRCSLEEDLDEVIHDEMIAYLPDCKDNPILYLQESKQFHMAELVKKLKSEDCQKIRNHYNFKCLDEVL